MSETDSFLQEVSEELRRDKLYRNMRKYGWIGLLLVLIIVCLLYTSPSPRDKRLSRMPSSA